MLSKNLIVVAILNFILIVSVAYKKDQFEKPWCDIGYCQIPPRHDEPEFVVVPIVNNRIKEDSVYADIINHTQDPILDLDRDSNAHESTHRANSDIRNLANNLGYQRYNGFYVTGGRGVVVLEPNIKKHDIIAYIPNNLKSYRYNTYVSGQTEWDSQPLYILDEWTAYINGATVSLEDLAAGRHNGEWSDAVSGCLDFSIYAVSVAMAVYDLDPEYWEKNQQFRAFVEWQLKRAYTTYQKGYKQPQFKWETQDALYNHLLNDAEAEPMRKFILKHFDGVWIIKPLMAKKIT